LDGKIVVGGGGTQQNEIFRLTRNGFPDKVFGINGRIEHYGVIGAISVQTDGRIIAVGGSRTGDKWKALVLRFNSNGSPDESFGVGGAAEPIIGTDSILYSVATQTGNKIVAAGTGWNSISGSYDALVLRIIGALPPSAPTDLSVSAVPLIGSTLTWKDNSDNETGFKIERKAGGCDTSNEWKQIGSTGADINTFADTGVMTSFQYSYRVRAYNSIGSSYSNCAAVSGGQ